MFVVVGSESGTEGAYVCMEGFTAHQACKFTGCSSRQLRYWDQIGLVEPSVKAPAVAQACRVCYSFRDLVALRVVRSLIDGGMSLQRVRRSWEFLNKKAGLDRASVRGPACHRRTVASSRSAAATAR